MATFDPVRHDFTKASAFMLDGNCWIDVEPGSVQLTQGGGVVWRDAFGDTFCTVQKLIKAIRWDNDESE